MTTPTSTVSKQPSLMRAVVLTVLAAVLLAGAHLMVFSPASSQVAELNADVDAAQARADAQVERLASIDAGAQDMSSIAESRARAADDVLPTRVGDIEVLNRLLNEASRLGITVTFDRTGQVPSVDSGLVGTPIVARLTGSTENLNTWLSSLAALRPLTTVTGARVNFDDGDEVSATVQMVVWSTTTPTLPSPSSSAPAGATALPEE